MASNLLDLITRAISPATVKSVSDHLGESQASVQSGIALLLASLLAGLAAKASRPAGAASVFSTLTDARVDTGTLGNLSGLLGSGQSKAIANVGSIGDALLASVFGTDEAIGLGPALAGITGMRPGNAGSLAALVVPALFGWLKQLITERDLNAARAAELLIGQRDHLVGQLEPALTQALGLGTPTALLGGLAPRAGAAPAIPTNKAVAAGGLLRWMPWLVAALLGLATLWYAVGSGDKGSVNPRAPAAAAST